MTRMLNYLLAICIALSIMAHYCDTVTIKIEIVVPKRSNVEPKDTSSNICIYPRPLYEVFLGFNYKPTII